MILALDLATRTGFVAGRSFDSYHSGVLVFDEALRPKDKCRAAVLAEAQCRLEALVDDLNPETILYEAPFFRGSGSRLLSGFCALLEATAARRGISLQEIASLSARKTVLGTGKATKDDIAEWLSDRNILFESDDEADAYILYLSYFMSLQKDN